MRPPAIAVHVRKPEPAEGDLLVRAVESPAWPGGASLATARVVVGGGRGVGGPEGFAPPEDLAGLLGGVVGVSRVVTSEGWRSHDQQVGQTGTKITPELYYRRRSGRLPEASSADVAFLNERVGGCRIGAGRAV